ncbi:metalloregulator ArsR/SmtB family transcription factor [Bradyrhizobium roseum]|uniref:metalloregulator ArsR/SmtB family transcription factor n=1 Tax=Bradyrhizobium roseum TaxID=3056648 RepID=UPI00263004A3|nr:metalloregulator ArsR/SmtB family transcription factor [Bradyrhizobium roseus]WKA31471.1 metalloregulator ArsR/SmtB family transcription factor [Bradyrhizobium roseus]
MEATSREASAIEGFGSLAQPTRLAAVRHLLAAHPGSLPAGEIARLCEVPHNTMSSHLSILSRAGLISAEKDGRSMNYRADIDGFRGLLEFLSRDCCNGRPELCGDAFDLPSEATGRFMTPAFNVLFLCTKNSARSIIAEALLEKIGRGRFRAYSAGSEPAAEPVPEVIERLKALGHNVSHLHSKSWDEFRGPDAPRMDFIIALCDAPNNQFCPDFGNQFVTGAWPLPDPAHFTGSPTERTTLLNELYAMIRRRIEIFTSLPFDSLDRMAIKARLDEIGDTNRVSP